MRSGPSAADRVLMRRVQDEHNGVTVSAAQLERWRHFGLLPKVEVRRTGFGGTAVPSHSEQVVRAAALLGGPLRKVRPWERKAELLFNDGFELSDAAVRAAAAYLVDDEKAKMTALWDAARGVQPLEEPSLADGGPAAGLLDDEGLGDTGLLGEKVAARVESLRRQLSRRRVGTAARQSTALLRAVTREIELAYKGGHGKEGDLGDYAGTALTWRVADLVVPEALSETQRNLARHGVEERMTPIGDGSYPLPSERFVVAHSLTWAEAEQYRPFAELRIKANSVLSRKDFGLLWVAIWIVTFERVKLRDHPLESPLPQSQLDAAANMLLPPAGS